MHCFTLLRFLSGFAVSACLLLVFFGSAAGQDWPSFGRSATRNAVIADGKGPTEWDVASGLNIKWRVSLGSETFAAPVVAGGRVYIGTNNGAGYLERYPNSVDLGCLLCFRESDGQFLWQYSAEKLPSGRVHDWPNQGLVSSPMVEGDRLWFVSNRHVVVCLDAQGFRDGENDGPVVDEPVQDSREADVVWQFDMIKELGVFPHPPGMGPNTRCSIAATFGNLIYVVTGNGTDEGFVKIPAPHAPSLICLDKTNGKVLWTDASPGDNILDCQASHPLVAEINGQIQVIVAQGDGWVRAFNGLTGELLWKFDLNRKTSAWTLGGGADRLHCLGTPVLYQGLVYVGSGLQAEQGEGPGRLVCIDPSKTGDISSELAVDKNGQQLPHRRFQAVISKNGEVAIPNPNSGLIWEFTQSGEDEFEDTMHRTLSTVAVHDGLVIAPDFSGMVHCLDATTGKKYWSYDAFAAIWASPLIVGKHVYVADEDGEVAIFELSPDPAIAMKKGTADEYLPLAEIAHDGPIYSSPIFANQTLYIATRSTLFAIAAPQTPDQATTSSSRRAPASFRNSAVATSRVAKPIFSPTPQDVVERMLELAQLNQDDTVVDLGSGDGRIVTTAALKYGARAIGYETDHGLVTTSLARAREAGVAGLVDFKLQDMYTADLQQASLATVYLYPAALNKLKPQFSKMYPGAKIVSHHYAIPHVKPDRVITFRSKETGDDHKIWLYTVPLMNTANLDP